MFFDHLEEAPVDPIFGLKKGFLQDQRKDRTFLSVGIFQADDLKPKMFSSVQRAIKEIGEGETMASYLPIDGDPLFISEVGKLVFGNTFYTNNSERIYGAQTIGGTSALRIGGETMYQNIDNKIFMSKPTWSNHGLIFTKIGFEVFLVPYFDYEKQGFNFDDFFTGIASLPEHSAILLQPCCHNPTGADPTKEQWKMISSLLKKKKIMPIFDIAYHGFKSSIDDDAYAIRLFAESGHEMLIAYSCSKNFSLYRQRTGALFFLGDTKEVAKNVGTHVKRAIRSNYSNPPSFGKTVVTKVLTDPVLRNRWLYDLEQVRERLVLTRGKLADMLFDATSRDYSFLKEQYGMFSLLGLTSEQVDILREEYAIYLPSSGRINIAGLSDNNLQHVVTSIAKVL